MRSAVRTTRTAVKQFARAVLRAFRRSGEPSARHVVRSTVLPTASNGSPGKPLDSPAGEFPIERLDRLVHALRVSGKLAQLTPKQAHTILYALHAAGHFSYYADPSTITYQDDGLIAVYKDTTFLADPRFQAAYEAGRATGSWGEIEPRWRAYVVCWAAERATSLEGDFVECGVNRGGNAKTVMHYLNFQAVPKRFYLLDTFSGFPESQRAAAASCDLDRYVNCYADVVQTFRAYPNAVIVRGAIPGTLSQIRTDKVAFLSIDMNCAEPEIAAAEFFWDRLVPGAAIVLDDYACGPWYIRQKQAFDAFAQARDVRVLPLPTGQGLIFKP
jgi:O-methyltransferase